MVYLFLGSDQPGKTWPNRQNYASRSITLFELPARNSFPVGIAQGPAGTHSLWFCESNNKIGRITTDGTITEFNLQAPSAPVEIALGHDRAMWFTENGACAIGRITIDGSVKHYAIPSNSPPYGITFGT